MEWLEGTVEVIIFMKILESFPHLINPAVSFQNVLYFNMSSRVYQETLLFMMDAPFPSILKLYTYIKMQFNYNVVPRAGKNLFGNTSDICPLISSLNLIHKVLLPSKLINKRSAVITHKQVIFSFH